MMERCLKRVAEGDADTHNRRGNVLAERIVCAICIYVYICVDHVLMKGVGEYHCSVTLALEVR